jgi:UDP-GlcNAc:undecaprenyl-phosphate GlcNAc-1-phosphate transferase
MQVIPASIASFFIACTMLLALRPFAEVVGLIDRPGGRKTHHGDVPVVGGIAMFSGLLVAAGATPVLGAIGISQLVIGAFMVLVGALDDRFDLPPKVRLFAHLSSSVALAYATGFSVKDLGDLLGLGVVSLGPIAIPFTVVAVVALINAFNMLDGLDGLAGSVGAVALAGVMVIASAGGSSATVLVAASMLGAVVAFLMFNLPTPWNRPVRTFMGDAGSTLLGFVLAGLALVLVQDSTIDLAPVVVLWLMPIPIFELFTSTARRVVRGVSPAQADAGHFHHVLIKAGLSVRAVCALYFLVSLVCCCVGVLAYRRGVSESVMFQGFCITFCAWLLLVYRMPRIVALLPGWFRRSSDAGVGR